MYKVIGVVAGGNECQYNFEAGKAKQACNSGNKWVQY